MASEIGLEAITIGTLADETGMSKSGLFAHFKSKENLQIEILAYAGSSFTAKVVTPALKTTAGIPRISALVENWTNWSGALPGGCIFVTASTEFSDRHGKVRDYLLKQQENWINCLRRIAESGIRTGDLKPDIDVDQFAYDLYSMLLGFYHYYKLLNDARSDNHQKKSFARLLEHYSL